MSTLLRASLTAALTLPLALPAAASTHFSTMGRMPITAHVPQLGGKPVGPKEALLKLHAHRSSKVAHFSFPYGIATDTAGNLYVANYDTSTVVKVNPAFKVAMTTIGSGVPSPVSLAVSTSGDVYVGSIFGNVSEYASNGSLKQTITNNASYPLAIAVDQYEDLYLSTSTGVALDDPYGGSIVPNLYTATIYSIAIGGSTVNAFYNNTIVAGNGSVALRQGGFQFLQGPTGSVTTAGAACANDDGCWYDDSTANTLSFTLNLGVQTIGLPFSPAGLAFDGLRNRVFVADPDHNAIQVYNATTLALEKTIT